MTRRERIRHARGSNQFATRNKAFQSTYWTFLIFPVVMTIGLWAQMLAPYLEEATTVRRVYAVGMISPLPEPSPSPASVVRVTPTPAPAEVLSRAEVWSGEGLQEEIEAYIREVFGDQGDIAVAVSRRECSPSNTAYPHCVLHTSDEYSVGIFQINLYSERGWIHAGKVPGETMEQKIEWAQDWRNNVRLAKEIHDGWQGWSAWSAYTNGAFLKELEGGEVE